MANIAVALGLRQHAHAGVEGAAGGLLLGAPVPSSRAASCERSAMARRRGGPSRARPMRASATPAAGSPSVSAAGDAPARDSGSRRRQALRRGPRPAAGSRRPPGRGRPSRDLAGEGPRDGRAAHGVVAPAPRSRAAAPARRRRSASASTLGAGGGQRVQRQVDPVELAVVLAAVLQVVDHLQRRAEGVVGRPGRAASPWTSSTKRPTGAAE